MQIKHEYGDIFQLINDLWSGAVDTFNEVYAHNKHNELFELIQDYFQESVPTMTEVNDFLWFESEYIYEQLGIDTENEED